MQTAIGGSHCFSVRFYRKYSLSTFSTGRGDSEVGKRLTVFILKRESNAEPAGAVCEIVAKMSAFQLNDCIETAI